MAFRPEQASRTPAASTEAREPAHVTDAQREAMLRAEQRRERPGQSTNERPINTYLQTYSEYSQNHASEGALLSAELLKFQKNGLAGPDSLAIYRDRLTGIQDYLQKLETYGSQLSADPSLDPRDRQRLEAVSQKNRDIIDRITEALRQSDEQERVRNSAPLPSAYIFSDSVRQRNAQPAQSVEASRPVQPAQPPSRFARFGQAVKKFFNF